MVSKEATSNHNARAARDIVEDGARLELPISHEIHKKAGVTSKSADLTLDLG